MQENVKTIEKLLDGGKAKMSSPNAGKISVADLTKFQTDKLSEMCTDFTIRRSGTGLTVIFAFS